jgi:hypothetical protein
MSFRGRWADWNFYSPETLAAQIACATTHHIAHVQSGIVEGEAVRYLDRNPRKR